MSLFPKKWIPFSELLKVSRPLWWVATAMPFVGSYLIINGRADALLAVGTIYFAIAYNLAMYGINDIFDYESDMRNPRKNSVHGAIMPKSLHASLWFWIALINAPFLVWLFAAGSLQANLWLVAMLFMVVAYSVKGLRFKEIPFVDSLTSSFHYTSPFIYGGLLAGADNLYFAGFLVFYLWAVANHALGAVQDITPDREAGIGSIARTLGAGPTIIFCSTIYFLTATAPTLVYGGAALVMTLLMMIYVVNAARTYRHKADDTHPAFKQAWNYLIYINYAVGFVLTLLLLYEFKPFEIAGF